MKLLTVVDLAGHNKRSNSSIAHNICVASCCTYSYWVESVMECRWKNRSRECGATNGFNGRAISQVRKHHPIAPSSFFSFFFPFDMGLFGRVFPLYSSRATFISNRIFAAQRVRGRSQEQQGRIKKRGFLRLLQPPTSRVESSRVRSRSPAESICICQTASRATCVINIRERKTPPPFIDVWT